MTKWELNHCGNSIVVENRYSGEKLYVNGELQDEQMGYATRSRLRGKLNSGEDIKVSIGGIFMTHCKIFIDNKLVFSK